MKVTILGSGTSIPHPHRASPGLVIRFEESLLLVDPSSGSLHRAERQGAPTGSLDSVLFSHFHPDHTGDLGPLLFALKNPDYFGGKRIRLIGPRGLDDLHRRLLDFYGDWVRLEEGRVEIVEMGNDEMSFSDWAVVSLPVLHTENSVGYRFTDSAGAVFAYSGDSDYCDNLIELCREADLALIESAQPSELKVEGHLTPALAARVALKAGVRQLLLTHLYPVCDGYNLLKEVREEGYSGRVSLARDGMIIEVSTDSSNKELRT